jgi:putative DeoR family transcriptional regulator (stage III sporulation protein D)
MVAVKKVGVMFLKTNIEERSCELAEYIINNNATVRAAAREFGISKSTVHKDDGVIIGTVKGNAKKH